MNREKLIKNIKNDKYSSLELAEGYITPSNVFNTILNAEKYGNKIIIFSNFNLNKKDWIEKWSKVRKHG
jgi:hypothetical protein